MGDDEQQTEYVYETPTGPSIWSSILQSALVTCTSIFTVTVLVALMVAFLIRNSQRIMDLFMGFFLARVLGQAAAQQGDGGDDNTTSTVGKDTETSDDELFTFLTRQDTPMPFASQPALKQPGTGLPVDMRQFTSHEMQVLELLIQPSKLNVTWGKVAGSEELINNIKEQVIFPIRYAYEHTPDPLLMPPKGILLYGPPGCGKTLIAKALSYEIQAHFINFDISTIKNKWVGETEKMASALFSVARKLEPCIIFIDEVDSFLSQRGEGDQATESTLKAIFLQQWDGLTTETLNHVVVLAASNRIDAIDEAILRRLPLQFEIPLPQENDRLAILKIILNDCDLKEDVDLEVIANKSEGYSGSDLQEVCRHAATYRLVEYYKKMKNAEQNKVVKGPDLGKDLQSERELLVDPIRMFQQFKQLSETDESGDELSFESDNSNMSELISKESQPSMESSFMYQQLPLDIILSLLADEMEDMETDVEDDLWDEFRFPREYSDAPTPGERQNIPIDIVLEFVDSEEEKEDKRQVCFRSPEMGDKNDAENQEGCLEDNPFKNSGGVPPMRNAPIWEKLNNDDCGQKQMLFGPSCSSSDKKKSKLRPINMSDLLRALKHSRKANAVDYPRDMYN